MKLDFVDSIFTDVLRKHGIKNLVIHAAGMEIGENLTFKVL